ncbi:HEAT repeat domain-containing protein [Sulfurimonas aquatica]|uniref:HEAT repeat domain-containing protein n=1 Tax=Sulfurimonas aquatica TaxID=2672570 RepID=A0A975B039_9BACT|nr:HEAT repeat domain-containing protein [Sulfurimonas aquatica]QSZ41761.1 HEAT repeat domain-containing protein [Sulfurimonas aquatica]
MALLKETPGNIEQLIKQAGLKSDYKARLEALNELKMYDCLESREVILRLALHDKVYKVKELAFKAAKTLGIQKNGKPITLGKKNIGYKLEDFIKEFLKVKNDKEMDKLCLLTFKIALKKQNPEMYDVMEYEKKNKFDSWVKTSYNCLPKK